LQNRCNRAIKSRKCEFFYEYAQRANSIAPEPYDIEDLHKIAATHKICPFYMNKDRSASADLILMSYNYMLYESMRPNNTLNYENSIIIFDEAHNVPKCAEDAASF
jgi:regulator of telomere elongation helicase 1